MKWAVHFEGGPRRVNHAAVVLSKKIFSFGGYYSGEDYEQRRPIDVHALDAYAYQWESLPTPTTQDEQYNHTPYQRYGHTVVEYMNKAYLWGGRNDGEGACDILYQFEPDTCRWQVVPTTGQIPSARDGHSTCVIGNQMLVFGGFDEKFERFSNETFVLDFRVLKWMELHTSGCTPSWRDFHTATAIDNKMYVFGGRSDQSGQFHSNEEVYDDQLRYLDLNDNHWYLLEIRGGDRPCGRRSHSAWSYNDCMYVFGGYNGRDNRHFNDLYKFDAASSSWIELRPSGNGPRPRRRQCCVPLDHRVFLFGGTSPLSETSTFSHDDPPCLEKILIDHSDTYVLDMAPETTAEVFQKPKSVVEKVQNNSGSSDDDGLYCSICNKLFTGISQKREHDESDEHRRKMSEGSTGSGTTPKPNFVPTENDKKKH